MLLEFLEKGVTYIADRGYISFKLFKQITDKQAFFIIRLKSVIKVSVAQPLEVVIPGDWQGYFGDISDVDINIANIIDLLGFGTAATPLTAHSGYKSDDRVIALIVHMV
jgi:transposase